jgi:hypothetical protein
MVSIEESTGQLAEKSSRVKKTSVVDMASNMKHLDYQEDSDFRTAEIINRIKHLQGLIDTFSEKTERGKIEVADFQTTVDKLEFEHKSEFQGATEVSLENSRKESRRVIGRMENSLEDTLEKMRQTKGAEEQRQGHLKTEINGYRIERRGISDVARAFKRELEEKKKRLRKVILTVNSAQLTRLACEEHITVLKNQIASTEKRFEADWIQLNELVFNERNESENLVLAEKKSLRMFWDRDETASRVRTRDAKLSILREDASEQSKRTAIEKEKFEEAKFNASRYEERIAELKNKYNLDNMTALVDRFSEKEVHIFGLMKQVNELNAEAERFEQDARERKEELRKLSGETETRSRKMKEWMAEIEKRELAVSTKADDLNQKIKLASSMMGRLQRGLRKVFLAIDCEKNIPSADGLGIQEITESSTMSFVGVIQERLNQVLAMHDYVKADSVSGLSLRESGHTNLALSSSLKKPASPPRHSHDLSVSVNLGDIPGFGEKLEQMIDQKMMADSTSNSSSSNVGRFASQDAGVFKLLKSGDIRNILKETKGSVLQPTIGQAAVEQKPKISLDKSVKTLAAGGENDLLSNIST